MTRALKPKSLSILLGGSALVAVMFGAVQMLRGPKTVALADMNTAIVAMQNGETLRVQKREVTVAQWKICYEAGYCTLSISNRSALGDYPATGLSYPDAMEYLRWMNATGDTIWRLPTAAEWTELAAEVMPKTPDPIFTDPSLTWASTYLTEASRTGRALRPSGSFSVTSTGIEDLDGNVWEWTRDCYAGSDGQGSRTDPARCPAYVMGGEHEAVMSYLVRDPARGGCAVGTPPAHLGIRLVAGQS
ncbi:SUMF1/EgtB/PvdO family nonheme iron enzyme [uncultured Sulfitobacter sp.]|uniref:formylglycine-generating enzyme family protein n=1 Tax=uncultured Sulfitobacter sp. TaxID=191468 RepID=UPI00261E08FF|nr:SUMF1/EgtB/PvdO family nonheme iron enzyme [uncultured Sulfitobacter sp.]